MSVEYYPHNAVEIRNGTVDRIKAMGLFKTVYVAKTMSLKTDIAHDLLPTAIVWNLGEECEPLGDDNCGNPKFRHMLRLAIDIVTTAGSESDLDADIIELVHSTMSKLYNDYSWVNLAEGHHGLKIDYAYPKETGEYLARGLINISVTYVSFWNPEVPNDLREVSFATPQNQFDTPVFQQIEIKQ